MALSVVILSLATPPFGTNLLVNGDAEANFGAKDATRIVKASAWQTTGDFTVVQYGARGPLHRT